MSTLGQPHPEPAWKQEVSRRIAAHKSRRGAPQAAAPAEHPSLGGSRAAEAAARVAARYAKAPSYTQMQAEEARTAVRAAEIATQVALEAQAAAQSALAELHAAATEPPSRGPAAVEPITRARVETGAEVAVVEPELPSFAPLAPSGEDAGDPEPESMAPVAAEVHSAAKPATPKKLVPKPAAEERIAVREPEPEPVITRQIVDGQSYGIRWEPDAPVRVLQPRPARQSDPFELSAEDWWTPAEVGATLRHEPIAFDSEQTSANLVEFPRELVATRKMRPRLVEPPAAVSEAQLSIFEVDPGTVSTEPPSIEPWVAETWSTEPWSTERRAEPPAVAVAETTAHEWLPLAPRASIYAGPEWSGMELDEHPQPGVAIGSEPAAATQRIFLASPGRRLMAMVVDGALILATFFAAAMAVASRLDSLPAPRAAEVLGVFGIVFAGFLYHAFFFAWRLSTPGMRYAGVALSTFDDESPTRAQLRRRLGAMALSMLPVGLGFAWSIFDEDHLSWHDRISQTYLRKR